MVSTIQVIQIGQRLGSQGKAAPVLAQFGEHTLVIDPGQDLELINQDKETSALGGSEPRLFRQGDLKESHHQ